MKPDPDRAALRRVLLNRRDNTSDEMLEMASESIRRRIRGWPPMRNARLVGTYCHIGSEIRTDGINQDVQDAGKTLLLPAISADSMQFRIVHDSRDLALGPFGISEPKRRCAPAVPDVVVVPTVAVTTGGVRLGYGHGYYDAYLARHHIESVAATLEKQVARKIPQGPCDILVDWVVTEDRLFRV